MDDEKPLQPDFKSIEKLARFHPIRKRLAEPINESQD